MAGNLEDFGQEIKCGIFKNEQQPVGEVKEKGGGGEGPKREEEGGVMGNYYSRLRAQNEKVHRGLNQRAI